MLVDRSLGRSVLVSLVRFINRQMRGRAVGRGSYI